MIKEQTRTASSGYLALAVPPALTLLFGWLFIRAAVAENLVFTALCVLVLLALFICYKGFFMVHPNQAKVLQLFGTCVGSVRRRNLRLHAGPAKHYHMALHRIE